jgi:uncharacterized protein YidB (DUF937 family)
MKKLLSILASGLAVLAVTGTVLAATPSATTTNSENETTIEAATHSFSSWNGKASFPELLSLLKIDAKTLKAELKNGKSLAEIAAAQGVDKQQVIDLLVKNATERINKAVQSGKFTQDEADKKIVEITNQIKQSVEAKGKFFIGHPMHHHRGKVNFAQIAAILGMDENALKSALKAGKTLAQIANEQGMSNDELVNQLLQHEKERITKWINKQWQDKAESTIPLQ